MSLNKALLVFGLLALPTIASAEAVLYSNIGMGYPTDAPTSYTAGFDYIATLFTVAVTGPLSSLEIGLADPTASNSFGAALYTNSSAEPGTLLESWSAPLPVGNFINIPPLTVLASVGNPVLYAGSSYWLVLTEPANQEIVWYANDQNVAGGMWSGNSITGLSQFFPNDAAPGIQLNAVAPEPSSGVMFGLGCGLTTLSVWRRRTVRRRLRVRCRCRRRLLGDHQRGVAR
jgi:hypothetical protein